MHCMTVPVVVLTLMGRLSAGPRLAWRLVCASEGDARVQRFAHQVLQPAALSGAAVRGERQEVETVCRWCILACFVSHLRVIVPARQPTDYELTTLSSPVS